MHLHVPRLHDAADFGEKGGDLRAQCEVPFQRVRDEDVLERDGEAKSGNLQRERVAVVDGVGGAHGFAEAGCFGARGRGDDGEEVEVKEREKIQRLLLRYAVPGATIMKKVKGGHQEFRGEEIDEMTNLSSINDQQSRLLPPF